MSRIKEKFNHYVKVNNQIVCVTCYDASFSKILDDLKIDIVLVGDSLGMVIKGDEEISRFGFYSTDLSIDCQRSQQHPAVALVQEEWNQVRQDCGRGRQQVVV